MSLKTNATLKTTLICFLFFISTTLASAATCQGAWGDDGVTYPVPASFSQFSDSDVVGLNCHLSGSQCPVPQVEGTCDTSNRGFMECNIQVRDSGGTWTSIAKSTSGENCDFNDDAGSNFASVSNFMIDHNDVTDIRCKAFVYSYDATFDVCFVSAKGHDKRDDWWYNENTPTASNVVINPGTPNTLDDLDCDYTFNDADNDSENLSAVQYKWYINDVDVGVNSATLGNNSTDVSDIVVCSVKVFDDVFVTGNEAFVNSSPVNISDANETPGTLPQRREMSLDFEDKVETSYVMNGRHRVVEVFNDDKLYLHNDNVGSSSLKTDDAGEIDSEIITLPFGSQKADTGDGSSKSFFTGKETDNTGLQYFGSRYYDPTSGRFTQIDPIQRSTESNYHYARNNPNTYIDPDGRDATAATLTLGRAVTFGAVGVSAAATMGLSALVAIYVGGMADLANPDPIDYTDIKMNKFVTETGNLLSEQLVFREEDEIFDPNDPGHIAEQYRKNHRLNDEETEEIKEVYKDALTRRFSEPMPPGPEDIDTEGEIYEDIIEERTKKLEDWFVNQDEKARIDKVLDRALARRQAEGDELSPHEKLVEEGMEMFEKYKKKYQNDKLIDKNRDKGLPDDPKSN